MAIFTNQATLSYNGTSTNSNVAFGEILDVLTATKTSVENTYAIGDTVTYVVALRNTGNTALTNLTVSDDLGGYEFGGTTVYPLNFVDGSVLYYVNGILQPTPTVTAGPPLSITGINIPADSDAVIVYQATVTNFANPDVDGSVTNTVTVSGDGINTPVTASDTITSDSVAQLSISKTISPAQVVDNDRVTYTFIIQNTGNEAVVATSDAVITDTFNPILTDLSVSYNGNAWTQGVNYNYDETTGLFTTIPTNITVPAATFVQDATTGEYILTPGIATLTVEGTI